MKTYVYKNRLFEVTITVQAEDERGAWKAMAEKFEQCAAIGVDLPDIYYMDLHTSH
jgi:hypothetical protein